VNGKSLKGPANNMIRKLFSAPVFLLSLVFVFYPPAPVLLSAAESTVPPARIGPDREGKSKKAPEIGEADQGGRKLLDLFGRIAKNMQLIEKLLKKRDVGPSVKQSQQEVLRTIDELIEELKKRQQCCQGSGGGSQMQRQTSSSKNQQDQQASKKRRPGEKQSGRKPKTGKAGRRKESQGKVPNVRRAREEPPPAKVGGPLTGKRGSGGWGFLPGEVRALLDAAGRTSLPQRYAELIRLYFERLSKTSSQK